jgi:hypothetical protein
MKLHKDLPCCEVKINYPKGKKDKWVVASVESNPFSISPRAITIVFKNVFTPNLQYHAKTNSTKFLDSSWLRVDKYYTMKEILEIK